MTSIKEVELSNIITPERSEKLHPWENEETPSEDRDLEDIESRLQSGEEVTDWEQFRFSVGHQPDEEPVVHSTDNGKYRLIDGDRRIRAVKSNDADTIRVKIEEDQIDEASRMIQSVRRNEDRLPNDPYQRAVAIAKLTAPELVEPGERFDFSNTRSQSDLARDLSKDQAQIAQWLDPLREENPIRDVVAGVISGRRIDETDLEKIDDIVDLLMTGGDSGQPIIQNTRPKNIADKIDALDVSNIDKLRSVAETSAKQGQKEKAFLTRLEEETHEQQSRPSVSDIGSSGFVGDPEQSLDDTGSDFESEIDEEETETTENQIDQFMTPQPNVDVRSLVDGSNLPRGIEFSDIDDGMVFHPFRGETAQLIRSLAFVNDSEEDVVVEDVVSPLVSQIITAMLEGDDEVTVSWNPSE